ncbi:MAG: ABC transporter ATP-binding protein/permease [Peptococcaceae bacterium]|jgi:ATP-binding cassette subfamily B protein|nr:ABC transporter ATP-binding protein/permease [Peptococcaceae bacterium]
MSKVIEYLKPYAGMLLLAVALLVVQANCDLALPDYMSEMVNKGVAIGDSAFIWECGAKMLIVTLVGAAASVIMGFFAARIAAGVSHDMRLDVFNRVQGFSSAEIDKFGSSSLITRTTNDITQIQTLLVMGIRMVIYAPILGAGGVFNALTKSTSMTLVIGGSVGVVILLILFVFLVAVPKFQLVQQLVDRINTVARENLDGMLVTRAFSTQKFEESRFDAANVSLTETNLFINRVMAVMMPFMMLVMNLTTVIIIWVGSNQVSAFQTDVGDMMAFMQYSMLILMSFLMLAMMFILIPRAAVSAERIKEVLETESSVPDEGTGRSSGADIEFRDVDFAYPAGDKVLRKISFTAKEGETTAVIGTTGSGKSTLMNLLMRFYDVSGGQIKIGGVDLRELPIRDLRDKIGYIPQKSMLFSGTVRSNLLYGDPNASDEQMRKAAEISRSLEFIEARPDAFDSEISQGGTNVSGGQRQRLSIARAIVKNAPVYVFDDSFSALDFKTDAALRAAIRREIRGATLIIVAQRISTIMDAQQIIVLDNGTVAGRGTHKELLQTCAVYKEIAESQLSEKELSENG